jgi:cytochrome d ubiquinol oxidase subunit I
MWHTEPAPASFNLIAIPNQAERKNDFAIEIPYVMGIIGTRSLTTPLLGIDDLIRRAENRIRDGMVAYDALQKIRANPKDVDARMVFDKTWPDLGYALLVKRYQPDMSKVTEDDIKKAAVDTVPNVAVGMYLILFFGVAFWLASRGRLDSRRGLLKVALWSLPLPWVAIESGWFVAEYGRQPWVIEGVLPTYYAASGLTIVDLAISLTIFLVLYTVLLIIGVKVMLHAVRKGPKSDGPAPGAAAADPVHAAVRA